MKKIHGLVLVVALIATALLAACQSAASTSPSGSSAASGSSSSSSAPASSGASQSSNINEPDTITIAWLPNNSVDNEQAVRDELAAVISKATGKKVENKITTDYNIAISAIETGNAQLGYFGPYEYLTSHASHSEIVPLLVESGDSGTLSDALYNSRFLVKKGNETQYASGTGYAIDNIVGKKIAFVSTSSTSGFNMPTSAILGQFTTQDKYKSLTKDDLSQAGKFFSQVIFAGSHQLALQSLLTDKADVATVDDGDVAQYVQLTSGKDNTPGAVYTVKQGAAAPFDTLAGAQFVVIKDIPVLNTPLEANSKFLSQKTLDAITNALISDDTTNDTKLFSTSGAAGAIFVKPHRFLKIQDSWYDSMRQQLGIK